MDKDTENNIIPFKKRLPNPTNPGIEGFDEYGVPNIPQTLVFGLTIKRRGKTAGTFLFTSKEKRDNAYKVCSEALKELGWNHEYQYVEQDYPVF